MADNASLNLIENPVFNYNLTPADASYNSVQYLVLQGFISNHTGVSDFSNNNINLEDSKKILDSNDNIFGFSFTPATDISNTDVEIFTAMGTSIFYTYDANNLINANITTNSVDSEGLKSITLLKPYETMSDANKQVDLYTSIIPHSDIQYLGFLDKITVTIEESIINNLKQQIQDLPTNMQSIKSNPNVPVGTNSSYNAGNNIHLEIFFYEWNYLNGPWFKKSYNTILFEDENESYGVPTLLNISEEISVPFIRKSFNVLNYNTNIDPSNSDINGLKHYTYDIPNNGVYDNIADTSDNYVTIYKKTDSDGDINKLKIYNPKYTKYYFFWTYKFKNAGTLQFTRTSNNFIHTETYNLEGTHPYYTPGVYIRQTNGLPGDDFRIYFSVRNIYTEPKDNKFLGTNDLEINNDYTYIDISNVRIINPSQPSYIWKDHKLTITVPVNDIRDINYNYMKRFTVEKVKKYYFGADDTTYVHLYSNNEILRVFVNLYKFEVKSDAENPDIHTIQDICGNIYEINDANRVNHPANILYKVNSISKETFYNQNIIIKTKEGLNISPTTYSEIYDSQQNTYNVEDAGYTTFSTTDNIYSFEYKKNFNNTGNEIRELNYNNISIDQTEINKLTSHGNGEGFGKSIKMYGNYVAIGAPNHDNNRGCVYIFKNSYDVENNINSWKEIGKLTSPDKNEDGSGNAYFGHSVSIWGVEIGENSNNVDITTQTQSWLVVGSPGCQNNRGRVYIFKKGIDYANDIYGNTTNIIKNENFIQYSDLSDNDLVNFTQETESDESGNEIPVFLDPPNNTIPNPADGSIPDISLNGNFPNNYFMGHIQNSQLGWSVDINADIEYDTTGEIIDQTNTGYGIQIIATAPNETTIGGTTKNAGNTYVYAFDLSYNYSNSFDVLGISKVDKFGVFDSSSNYSLSDVSGSFFGKNKTELYLNDMIFSSNVAKSYTDISNSGISYLFNRNKENVWYQNAFFDSDYNIENSFFATSSSITKNYIIFGNPGKQDGCAIIYSKYSNNIDPVTNKEFITGSQITDAQVLKSLNTIHDIYQEDSGGNFKYSEDSNGDSKTFTSWGKPKTMEFIFKTPTSLKGVNATGCGEEIIASNYTGNYGWKLVLTHYTVDPMKGYSYIDKNVHYYDITDTTSGGTLLNSIKFDDNDNDNTNDYIGFLSWVAYGDNTFRSRFLQPVKANTIYNFAMTIQLDTTRTGTDQDGNKTFPHKNFKFYLNGTEHTKYSAIETALSSNETQYRFTEKGTFYFNSNRRNTLTNAKLLQYRNWDKILSDVSLNQIKFDSYEDLSDPSNNIFTEDSDISQCVILDLSNAIYRTTINVEQGENETPTVFETVLDVTEENPNKDQNSDRNQLYGYLNNKKFNWKKEITLEPPQTDISNSYFGSSCSIYNDDIYTFAVVGSCQNVSNNQTTVLNDVFFIYTKSYKWNLIKQINLNTNLPYTQSLYTNIEQSTGQNLYDINIYKNKILIGTNSDIDNESNQKSFVYAFTIDVGNKYLSKNDIEINILGENSQNPKYILNSIVYDENKSYLLTKGRYLIKNIPQRFPLAIVPTLKEIYNIDFINVDRTINKDNNGNFIRLDTGDNEITNDRYSYKVSISPDERYICVSGLGIDISNSMITTRKATGNAYIFDLSANDINSFFPIFNPNLINSFNLGKNYNSSNNSNYVEKYSEFGKETALNSNWALIYNAKDNNVSVFKHQNGVWNYSFNLTAPNNTHYFGSNIVIDNSYAVISSIKYVSNYQSYTQSSSNSINGIQGSSNTYTYDLTSNFNITQNSTVEINCRFTSQIQEGFTGAVWVIFKLESFNGNTSLGQRYVTYKSPIYCSDDKTEFVNEIISGYSSSTDISGVMAFHNNANKFKLIIELGSTKPSDITSATSINIEMLEIKKSDRHDAYVHVYNLGNDNITHSHDIIVKENLIPMTHNNTKNDYADIYDDTYQISDRSYEDVERDQTHLYPKSYLKQLGINGMTLNLKDQILSIGIINEDSNLSGSVYLYNDALTNSSTTHFAKLTSPELDYTNTNNNNIFGKSISMNNNYLIIGAPQYDSEFINDGAAFLYRLENNDTLSYIQKITGNTNSNYNEFGYSVDIYNNLIVAGCRRENGFWDDLTSFNSGSVYLFKKTDITTNNQTETFINSITKLTSGEDTMGGLFGHSVKLTSNYLFISAPNEDALSINAGNLYTYSTQNIKTKNSIIYEGDNSKKSEFTITGKGEIDGSYNFYWGDISMSIVDNFGSASLYNPTYEFMGSENKLEYSTIDLEDGRFQYRSLNTYTENHSSYNLTTIVPYDITTMDASNTKIIFTNEKSNNIGWLTYYKEYEKIPNNFSQEILSSYLQPFKYYFRYNYSFVRYTYSNKEPYDRTQINRYLYDYNHLISNAAYFDYTSYQNTYIPGKLEITKLNQVAVPILTNEGRFDNIVGWQSNYEFWEDYSGNQQTTIYMFTDQALISEIKLTKIEVADNQGTTNGYIKLYARKDNTNTDHIIFELKGNDNNTSETILNNSWHSIWYPNNFYDVYIYSGGLAQNWPAELDKNLNLSRFGNYKNDNLTNTINGGWKGLLNQTLFLRLVKPQYEDINKTIKIKIPDNQIQELFRNLTINMYNTGVPLYIDYIIYILKPKSIFDNHQLNNNYSVEGASFNTYDISKTLIHSNTPLNSEEYSTLYLPEKNYIYIKSIDADPRLIPGKWSAIWSYKVNYDYRNINYSLNTGVTFTSSNSKTSFGNIFTIKNISNKRITITGLLQGRAANNTSNTATITVRYVKDGHTITNNILDPSTDNSVWIEAGEFQNVQLTKDETINGQLTQQYTGVLDIPNITFEYDEEITFHINSSVAIDYITGTQHNAVLTSNNHLQFFEGAAGGWSNPISDSPGIWNGTINYSLEDFYTGSGDENVTFDITLDPPELPPLPNAEGIVLSDNDTTRFDHWDDWNDITTAKDKGNSNERFGKDTKIYWISETSPNSNEYKIDTKILITDIEQINRVKDRTEYYWVRVRYFRSGYYYYRWYYSSYYAWIRFPWGWWYYTRWRLRRKWRSGYYYYRWLRRSRVIVGYDGTFTVFSNNGLGNNRIPIFQFVHDKDETDDTSDESMLTYWGNWWPKNLYDAYVYYGGDPLNWPTGLNKTESGPIPINSASTGWTDSTDPDNNNNNNIINVSFWLRTFATEYPAKYSPQLENVYLLDKEFLTPSISIN